MVIPFDGEDAAMRISTLGHQVLSFLKDTQGYSPNTTQTYQRVYDQFVAFLRHERRLSDELRHFTKGNVFAFVEYLGTLRTTGGKRLSPNTIIKTLSALSTLAKQAQYREDPVTGKPLMTSDPTKAFPWPTAEHPETKYLHPTELKAILDVDAKPFMLLARDALLETGLRRSELCRASRRDFRQVDGKYFLAVTVKGRGTRSRAIEMPLSLALGDRIWEALAVREAKAGEPLKPDAPLLVGAWGQRLTGSSLSCSMARLGKRAGITRFRLSSHKFRHTANVLRKLGGVEGGTRAKLLGQSSARSQERYDHIIPGERHEAIERQIEATERYIRRGDQE